MNVSDVGMYTADTKQKRCRREGNTTQVLAIHPVLQDMFMRAPVEECLPRICCVCAPGVYTHVCLCVSMQIEH